ncbi:MAG: sec-independent protein translocase protein TatC [Methanolobus sp.]|nr:sec-independent protein translocase protein TatC [Methanolobus sp.]
MPDYTCCSVNDVEQPLKEHLKEIRKRMMVFLIGLFFSMLFFYPLSDSFMRNMWDNLVPPGINMSLYSPLEWIFLRFKISFLFASVVSLPLLLYETFKFMEIGLNPQEKTFFLKIVPYSFLLFICGSGIAYFLIIPIALKYFIFSSNELAISQVSVQKTFSAMANLIFGFGLIFQLPLLVVSSIKVGLVRDESLRRPRILMYTSLGSLAFFISPDPTFISQLILAVLFIILFEFSLIIVKII